MAHRSDVADVNAANAAGDTLLHIAAGNGHELCYLSRDMWCYSTRAVRRDSSRGGASGRRLTQQNWPQEFGLGAITELIVKTPNTKWFRRQA